MDKQSVVYSYYVILLSYANISISEMQQYGRITKHVLDESR